MPTISLLLDSALTEEPDYRPDVDRILALARRTHRNRRLAVLGSGGALTAVAGGLVLALVTAGPAPVARPAGGSGRVPQPAAAGRSTTAPSSRPAPATSAVGPTSASGGTDVHGITKANLAALVERHAHVRLSGVTVADLPPTGDINLSGGIASAQDQYLNVQVTPAGGSATTAPTCADLGGSTADGDGYAGPCHVTTMPAGGYLVVRQGRTADSRYAKTQADLISSDGASILAEATNQLSTTQRGIAPVVSHDPPLTTAQLRALVLALNAQR